MRPIPPFSVLCRLWGGSALLVTSPLSQLPQRWALGAASALQTDPILFEHLCKHQAVGTGSLGAWL